MATRTLTAMFTTREQAEQARAALTSELRLDPSATRTSPEAGMTDAGYDQSRPYEEKGFFGSLKNLFVPDEDRYAYAEGMRRGNVLVSAKVDEAHVGRAADILEHAGAVNLDEQEAAWRQSGWTGYNAAAHSTVRPVAAAPAVGMATARGSEAPLEVVEERLVVGKRMVEAGRVRVRSYVIERPVEEQVTLHEERVRVERHPVDRAATPAAMAAFQERTIEAQARSEEVVVGKEVRVVEEIGVTKQAADRVETIHDTVRRTQVEVEGDAGVTAAPGTMPGRAATGPASGTTTGAATGAAAATDRTLGTNMSGANPGANAPDGTPGNPPGTMASRAVDKTLGTNISGANPGRK